MNNTFKISTPTRNDEFNFPDGSYSIPEIQYYFECIIKKHETIANNPPVLIYVNKIKNRIVFQLKAGYKLTLISWNNEIIRNYKIKMLIKIKMINMYQN